jgi:hypothetical protein
VIAELLGRLLLAAQPEALGAELLLAAGVLAVVFAVVALLHVLRPAVGVGSAADVAGFATLRVLLRMSDPAAAGHPRARAPGSTR